MLKAGWWHAGAYKILLLYSSMRHSRDARNMFEYANEYEVRVVDSEEIRYRRGTFLNTRELK